MALAQSASDGFRRLDVTVLSITGASPQVNSLALLPILRPYTLFAVARITDAAGNVFDLNIVWQAQPRMPDNELIGERVGSGESPGLRSL